MENWRSSNAGPLPRLLSSASHCCFLRYVKARVPSRLVSLIVRRTEVGAVVNV